VRGSKEEGFREGLVRRKKYGKYLLKLAEGER